MADPNSVTDPNPPTPSPPQRNGGLRPVPDPTELTDRAIAKVRAELLEIMEGRLAVRDERLRGIDEATKLRLDSVAQTADQFNEQVGRLREVTDEKFLSVKTQFGERDTRSERESRDNKVAVDAAFAAQKEAAAKQDESNAKAIDKSEATTKELLNQLRDQIGDLKGRLDRGEGRTTGGLDARSLVFAVVGVLFAAAGLALAFLR